MNTDTLQLKHHHGDYSMMSDILPDKWRELTERRRAGATGDGSHAEARHRYPPRRGRHLRHSNVSTLTHTLYRRLLYIVTAAGSGISLDLFLQRLQPVVRSG